MIYMKLKAEPAVLAALLGGPFENERVSTMICGVTSPPSNGDNIERCEGERDLQINWWI